MKEAFICRLPRVIAQKVTNYDKIIENKIWPSPISWCNLFFAPIII